MGIRKAPAKKAARRRPGTGKPAKSSEDLSPAEEEFLAIYVANGFNGTAAYREVHPNASDATARVQACRRLTKPNVRDRLGQLLENRWQAIHMTGDEVLARVAMDARSDIRLLVDEHGKRLKLHELPDDIVNSIEAAEFDEQGGIVKVKFASKTAARRSILEVTGKVKGDSGIDELAAALRQTLEQNAGVGK